MSNFESRCETYKHIKRVNELLIKFSTLLLNRAVHHDDSKLEEPEASVFEEVTPALKKLTYNSPEYKEQLSKIEAVLKHHYAKNLHHPQHFKNGIRDMSLLDLVEMFLDWKAASERHDDGNLNKSIQENQGRFGYTDELKCIMENTAKIMEN